MNEEEREKLDSNSVTFVKRLTILINYPRKH